MHANLKAPEVLKYQFCKPLTKRLLTNYSNILTLKLVASSLFHPFENNALRSLLKHLLGCVKQAETLICRQ